MAENPLRILVIGNLPPHVLGGAENQVARLVEAWLSAGAHVEVAGHRIPDGDQLLGATRVRTHHLRTWRLAGRFGRAASYLLSLGRQVLRRRGDFDVVYCRGISDGVLVLVILAALGVCRWPIVACPINARGAGDVAFLRSIPGWRLWCLLIDRHVSAINLINTAIAEDLDAVGIVRAPRSHIPNGISVRETVIRGDLQRLRRLLWAGRLEHQKALDLLLPALAACKRDSARFRLVILGDGPLLESLRAQTEELGLSGDVQFKGAVVENSVRSYLLDTDVFVLPSRYEGMSNAALEAMETGLPVVCTRCGGIDAAVIDGAGWVCVPDDGEALKHSLGEMFASTDEELLRRGRRARELVEQRFAIEMVATANLALLAQVACDGERG